MIYVKLRFLEDENTYDISINEEAKASTAFEELFYLLDISLSNYYVLSENQEAFIEPNKSLRSQGIRGGDLLSIVCPG